MNKGLSIQGEKLLLETARCENFCHFASMDSYQGRCKNILESQNKAELPTPLLYNYHLPEPWNGNIENARVVFVSSNPSIDKDEICPTYSWINDPDKIVEFFLHRFDEQYGWTYRLGVKKRLPGGTIGYGKPVRYWAEIKGRAKEIHDLETKEIEFKPGQYYAITEIVHCKSQKKGGVIDAIGECSQRYLDRVLTLAYAAKVVVLIDSDVIAHFNLNIFPPYGKKIRLYQKSRIYRDQLPDLNIPNMFPLKLNIWKEEKMFISLPTPRCSLNRSIDYWLDDKKKSELKKFLDP